MPIGIVIISVVSTVTVFLFLAYRQHAQMQISKNEAEVNEETQQQIAELKSRIEILEKIVTDESYELKREIDSLKKAG